MEIKYICIFKCAYIQLRLISWDCVAGTKPAVSCLQLSQLK